MQEILILATILAPIIVALTEVVKKSVNAPKEILPLVAVVIGAIAGLASQPFTDLDVYMRLWAGVLAGLSATGLFELYKQAKK